MRTALAVVAIFGVGFSAGTLYRGDPSSAAAQDGPPSCSGPILHAPSGLLVQDVDGDGGWNISDAVCLLNFLFLDTCAPKPLCMDPPAYSGLPATGQKGCFDASREVECSSDVALMTFPSQDGDSHCGCPFEARFIVDDNGTVPTFDDTIEDTCTGLLWQRVTAAPSQEFDPNGDRQLTWSEALQYCASLDLGGMTGWRLPNVRELSSLVRYDNTDAEPAIDPSFLDIFQEPYWSSTTQGSGPGIAWYVQFDLGETRRVTKGTALRVLAVRGCDP